MPDKQPDESDYKKRVADELRLLYTTAVAEIAGFKQQQWHIANYGVLIYAAIVSASRLLEAQIENCERLVLSLAAVIVCAVGCWLIHMFHSSIQTRRARLTYLRRHGMTAEFVAAWRAGKSDSEMPDRPEEKTRLGPLFYGVFILGLVATIWLVWHQDVA